MERSDTNTCTGYRLEDLIRQVLREMAEECAPPAEEREQSKGDITERLVKEGLLDGQAGAY